MADTSQRQRVVVTGIGVVSPLGQGVDNFWQNITSGQCGIDSISSSKAANWADCCSVRSDFAAS